MLIKAKEAIKSIINQNVERKKLNIRTKIKNKINFSAARKYY